MLVGSFDNPSQVCSTDVSSLSTCTVAVLGCGPGGMSFLHAVATKRKEYEEANDIEGLMKLPKVTVFEKASAPGGVWRADRHCTNSDESSSSSNGNMYEGLWINGHKDGMEYFDYTFQEHFQNEPQPVYLPRQQILDYIMARVTKHEDIFQHVKFNTKVNSVRYDEEDEEFDISYVDADNETCNERFDKCIWACGLNGKPNMPPEVLKNLEGFQGDIVHSSQINKLLGSCSSETKGDNGIKDKRVLMIGDSYSAEDLALQCIKMGVKDVYMTTRKSEGSASYMGSWPLDKVDILWYSKVSGIKNDGTRKTITFDSLNEDYPTADLEQVDIIILCTGYNPTFDCLEEKLRPWKESEEEYNYWCMEDIGESTDHWKMRENCLSSDLGNVIPSKELSMNSDYVYEKSYRNLSIDYPSMMFISETTSYPLLDIDVCAWQCLAYITGESIIPTKEEMLKANQRDCLELMHELNERYELDENFKKAWCELPDGHWTKDTSSEEYKQYMLESYSWEIRWLARKMNDAKYPITFGDEKELNKMGVRFLNMMVADCRGRYLLELCDEDTMAWKTFRDIEPSQFCSFLTDMGSTHLKGRWMDIDDEGNVIN
ncbi:hypothetical protein CTEN210_14822 [Chaetoceros tenuissimus]|uniref:Uncharacterized protein n=1 Tax=Chaetoceros tenuissimus TaxID=426638 RepID=A0AAD3D5P6_9STRA|nr:hypothetical protein CTEN210_14822 [Chaetoceros tenuissimus]